MWITERCNIDGREGEIISIVDNERALDMRDVISLWRDDGGFRDFFAATLATSPYDAFFWEMPPLDAGALAREFECAIIPSGALARMHADDTAFAEHLLGAEPVSVFSNLGGDALLIAPRKIGDVDCYGHIASFVRRAPQEQIHALFHCLAIEIEKRLAASRERAWVSTSGFGVPWVHVRLDRRPKYYQYDPYKA